LERKGQGVHCDTGSSRSHRRRYALSTFVLLFSFAHAFLLLLLLIDFWRMVWETNSSVVIMLAKVIEGGKVMESGVSSCHFFFLSSTLDAEFLVVVLSSYI
jgi:hypothetical protein